MLSLVLALLAAPQETPTVQVRMSQSGLYLEGSVLPMQNCVDGTSDVAHFVVGDQAFQVPRSAVKAFLPRRLKAAGPPPHDFETTEFLLPANAGCAEASTEMALVTIDGQTPALPTGVLLQAATFVSDAEVAEWRDSGDCQTEPDYVICKMQFRRNQEFPSIVMISRTETSRDGGPLFAVCEVKANLVPDPSAGYIPFESMDCTVRGSRGGMTYSATQGLKPTFDNMRAADNAVTELLDRISTP